MVGLSAKLLKTMDKIRPELRVYIMVVSFFNNNDTSSLK